MLAFQKEPPVQRTEKGMRYENWITEVRNLLDGKTKEQQDKAFACNDAFVRGLAAPAHRPQMSVLERAVTPAAVHVDSLLATMSVMYANDEYIGERLMPAVSVGKRSDKFATYPKRQRFAFPDDRIGYRASANELEATRATDNYSVEDFGYINALDLETVVNEDAPLNEMLDVIEAINEGIAFRREKRLVALLVASGSYSGNTAATATPWDNASGGSVVADLLAADAGLFTGATPTVKIGFCGLTVWNSCIATNPKLLSLYAGVGTGLVTPELVAKYFGLDEMLIGRAREDTANEGQTASYSRMWSTDVFGIVRVARRPSTRSLHFGSTFRMKGDPFTTEWPDPKIGKRGGVYGRVAVSEDHKIVAADAGFLVTNCIT